MNDWIVNEGAQSKPPVKLGTYIDVEHRDGERFHCISVGIGPAALWDFGPEGVDGEKCPGDIVKWRIHSSLGEKVCKIGVEKPSVNWKTRAIRLARTLMGGGISLSLGSLFCNIARKAS